MSVRDAEKIARSVAKDKVRKAPTRDPELVAYEKKFSENLGTRVSIEKKQKGDGGKIVIDYFSPSDLEAILESLRNEEKQSPTAMMERYIEEKHGPEVEEPVVSEPEPVEAEEVKEPKKEEQKAASLDTIFGEDSPLAFDAKEVGVEADTALAHEFEDEDDEDEEALDAYYAQLMFGSSKHMEEIDVAAGSKKTEEPSMSDTLSELDAITSHDIQEN